MIDTILNVLNFIAGTMLTFFLPGFTLIRILFPRKDELDVDMGLGIQIVLGMALSIVIVVLFGFIVGSPQLAGLNERNIWLGLGGLSLIFFIIGWYRGAYPFLGEIHPKLARALPQTDIVTYGLGPMNNEELLELQKIARGKYRLRKEIKNYERKARVQNRGMKEHYKRKSMEAQKQLKELDERMEILERKRAKELY